MDPRPAPSFQDDLAATLAEAWQCLARGAVSRRSAFHHPTVATIGRDGFPRARTMILRSVNRESRVLRFHTDIRGEKVAEITNEPRIAVHAYDPGHKLQVRLLGLGRLHHADPIAGDAWRHSQSMSQACYGVVPPPGIAIAEGNAFSLPEPHSPELAAGEANFAVLLVKVQAVETLYLAHRGHRRARFVWEGDSLSRQEWLSP